MNRIELTFALERETKNTYRYMEIAEAGDEAVGTIYVQKRAMRKAGTAVPPAKLTVVIEDVAGVVGLSEGQL